VRTWSGLGADFGRFVSAATFARRVRGPGLDRDFS